MSVRVYEGLGAAENGKGAKVPFGVETGMKSIGPASFELHNQGEGNVVLGVMRADQHGGLATDKDTAVADEDTTYDGTGAQLVFTGATTAETPVCPGSVRLVDAGDVAPDLIDRDGDGILYTDDDDQDAAGTVNYITGALELSYPTGKAPGTGADAIEANYNYQDALTVPGGKRTFRVNSVPNEVEMTALVATDVQGGSLCKVNGIATWI